MIKSFLHASQRLCSSQYMHSLDVLNKLSFDVEGKASSDSTSVLEGCDGEAGSACRLCVGVGVDSASHSETCDFDEG